MWRAIKPLGVVSVTTPSELSLILCGYILGGGGGNLGRESLLVHLQ